MKFVKLARALGFVICSLLLQGLLTTGQAAYGAEEQDAAVLSVSSCQSCGKMTEVISNTKALQGMKGDGCYVLGTDLDLQGAKWLPISDFAGHFDGNGHQLTDPYFSRGSMNVGLFSNITSSGVVENLMIKCTKISEITGNNGNNTGYLAGINEGQINHISVAGAQLQYTDSGSRNLGGLVGLNRGEIRQCSFSGDIVLQAKSMQNVGGIAGTGSSSSITEDCLAIGTISNTGLASVNVSGISSGDYAKIADCFAADTFIETGAPNKGVVRLSPAELQDISFLWLLNERKIGSWQWDFAVDGFPESVADLVIQPTVTLGKVSAITTQSALLQGLVADKASGKIHERRLVYGTDEKLGEGSLSVTADADFLGAVDGLLPKTDYYYQASADNRLGQGHSEIGKFTTLDILVAPAGVLSLVFDQGILTPVFSSDCYTYQLEIQGNKAAMVINVTPLGDSVCTLHLNRENIVMSDGKAVLVLAPGEHLLTVQSSLADQKVTYQIRVKVSAHSPNGVEDDAVQRQEDDAAQPETTALDLVEDSKALTVISVDQLRKRAAVRGWIKAEQGELSVWVRAESYLQLQSGNAAVRLSAERVGTYDYRVVLALDGENGQALYGQMQLLLPKAVGNWQAMDWPSGHPLPTQVREVDGQDYLIVTCWQSGIIRLSPRAATPNMAPDHWAGEVLTEAMQRGMIGRVDLETTLSGEDYSALLKKGLGVLPEQTDGKQAAFGIARQLRLNQPITREEAIVLLVQALRLIEGGREPGEQRRLEDFADGDQVAEWARADLAYALERGLIVGNDQGLSPQMFLTEAEGICLVMRLLQSAELI